MLLATDMDALYKSSLNILFSTVSHTNAKVILWTSEGGTHPMKSACIRWTRFLLCA
uniref:Uncharacterized protein n=1 Tax=Rhizophora mucronata TaxID=61149 RepID=A0A2P2IP37_RHIMU